MLRGVVAAMLLVVAVPLDADDKPPSPAAPSPQQQLELTRPGPEHERLKQLAGEWKLELRMHPESPRQKLTGTATSAMIVGDRFLSIDHATSGDPAMQGRFTLGFDRRHGEWVVVAMDSFGTYFVTAKGKESDGLIRMFGRDDDPVMKQLGFEKEFAFDLKLIGDDEFAMRINFIDTRTPQRKLIPFAEYAFTRKGQ